MLEQSPVIDVTNEPASHISGVASLTQLCPLCSEFVFMQQPVWLSAAFTVSELMLMLNDNDIMIIIALTAIADVFFHISFLCFFTILLFIYREIKRKCIFAFAWNALEHDCSLLAVQCPF